MPRTGSVLLFLALWGGVAGCLGDDAQHAAHAPAATHTATLAIEGMTCASCVVTVKVALGRLPGIAEVQVDTANGRAVVRFDRAQVDAARIAAAITDAGYPSSVLSEREV
jgi:mercuric ion binding protein